MDTKHKDIKVNGIIINVKDSKDYDKILTILTKELGKITVYSFGSRRKNSKNLSKTDLFIMAEFEIKLVKSNYNLSFVNVKEDFHILSNNYIDLCYASYFMELLSFFSFENMEYNNHLTLAYYSLKALMKNVIDKDLIRRIFELKCLQYEGIYIESNMLPANSSETLKYTWDYVLNNEGKDLFSFNLDNKYLRELDHIIDVEFHNKVVYNSKSLKLINSI